MKIKRIIGLVAALSSAFVLFATAQDLPEPEVVELKVSEANLSAEFSGFAGDKTDDLVKALRTGDSLSYEAEVERVVLDEEGNPVLVDVVNEDGTVSQVEKTEMVLETFTIDNTAGAIGLGNVKIALNLAQATLPEGSSYEEIVKSLFNADGTGILDLRSAGMGWGKIYDTYGLKVGEVMGTRSSRDTPEKVSKKEKANRPEKIEKPGKPEKPEKPGKPEKPNGNSKK